MENHLVKGSFSLKIYCWLEGMIVQLVSSPVIAILLLLFVFLRYRACTKWTSDTSSVLILCAAEISSCK